MPFLPITIKEMQSDGLNVKAGSAVAINIKTGGIIAAANYPTYTYTQYKYEYDKLLSDPGKPLFDRAFNGAYPPGSTFKPAMAAAALLVFVDTMKELPATLLLRPLNFETMATWLYAEASRGTYEEGAVAALMIVLVGLLPVMLLARTGLRYGQERVA